MIFQYQLQPALEERERKRAQAAEAVAAITRELDIANVRLAELTAERDSALAALSRTQSELAATGPDGCLPGSTIQERRERVEAMEEARRNVEAALFSQRIHIQDCEDEVTRAKQHLALYTRKVKLLEKHRARQLAKFSAEIERREETLQEEIGNALYKRRLLT